MGKRLGRFGLATIVAIILSMALSLVPIQPPAAEAQAGILPDLQTLEPDDVHITREQLDDGQMHYLLRFTNTIGNFGGRFEITAQIGLGNPIYQNLYNQLIGGSLVSSTRIATDLVYHPSHHHFHLADFARYNLLEKNPSTGRYIQTEFRGNKTSFCIIDVLRVAQSGPVDSQYQYCGETVQGLSHGWADYYDWQLPDQWIDLGTSLPEDGEYAIESIADPLDHLIESDRSNNTGIHYFRIQNGALAGAGDTPDCFIAPSSAQVGQIVQVSCNRLNPGDQVEFRMDSNVGPVVGHATVDDELKALLPLVLPPAPQGQHHIFAVPNTGGGPYSAIVNVQPNLVLGVNQGVGGATVPIDLTGFGSSETVSIRVNSVEVTQIPLSALGSATGSFVMPASKNGSNTIAAVGLNTGASSTKSFTIQPVFTLGNNWVHAGSPISTTLRGFGASENVNITLSGPNTLLKTLAVSNAGSSEPGPTTDLTLPANTPPGVYSIVATGATSGATSTASLQVLAPGADTPTVTTTPTPTKTTTATPTRTPTRTPTSTVTPSRTATQPPIVFGIGSIVRLTGPTNIRTGPCTSYPANYIGATGTQYSVLSLGEACNTYTFIHVRRVSDGTTGYLAAQNIALVATATPTRTPTRSASPSATPTGPTSIPTPLGGWQAGDLVRTNTSLNFRQGPGTDTGVILTFASGVNLLVTGGAQAGVGGIFIPVRHNGQDGWVASAYVTKIGTATPTPTPSISVTPSTTATASNTPTASSTATASNTPTNSPTATVTRTPSMTATATQTSASTNTPTSTPTRTPTRTATASNTPTRTATPPQGFGPGDIVQVTEPLNMRQTPGGTILQVLPVGARLVVTGTGLTAGQYFYIPGRYNGIDGWVATDWVVKVGTVTPTASPTITRTPTVTRTPSVTLSATPPGGFGNGDIVRVTELLNFRNNPTLSGTVLAVLDENTQLLVTGTGVSAEGYFWIPVRHNGTNGWVVSQYVQKIGVATSVPSTTPTRTATRTVTVTPSSTIIGGATFTPGPGGFLPGDIAHTRVRVNLRSSPGTTTNNIIDVLTAGTELQVTGYGQPANGYFWLPVETLGNTTGWIADNYLTAGVSPAAAETATVVVAPTETVAPTEAPTEVVEVENPRYDDAVLRWLPEIESASNSSGLTQAQVAALVAVMSGGDPAITSSLGAVGLTQLKPEELAAAGIGEGGWYDPATNISLGSALLAGMIDNAGSVEGGLATWFGEGCDDNGACTADYIQSYLTAVATFEAILVDPAAAGYVLLSPEWVAPAIEPYIGSTPLRFAPVPPTEEPTIAVPPTEEPTIEIPPTEEPTLEIPTDVPTEEPVETTPEEEPA